ncbi:MAG: Uncharacterised protein [Cryomorphaceae bacterium]|nr:MAG: Uncharacterised protein [Cryomorphaceae bacterium]
MRDGVMNVKYVDSLSKHRVHHFGTQRELIWLVFEQWVIVHVHLVVIDIRL